MKIFPVLIYISLVLCLTIISQTGGLILLLCFPFFRSIRKKFARKSHSALINLALFLGVYLFCTFLIVPVLAPLYGRVPLPMGKNPTLMPLNRMTYILNRHYVRPKLKAVLENTAAKMNEQYPGNVIAYLDAGFPFINGFPLIPHLSHDDGKKVDIAFFYKDAQTKVPLNKKAPSFIGYGVFEGPRPGESDYPAQCAEKGYWQYSLMERIVPQGKKDKMILDEERTKVLVRLLAKNASAAKIFIEPHLKERLHLQNPKIRYHGCQAVRHDDHLHVQL